MITHVHSDLVHHLVFLHAPAHTVLSPLSLHDALPICHSAARRARPPRLAPSEQRPDSQWSPAVPDARTIRARTGRPTSFGDRKSTRLKLQSRQYLVCRLLLEKKN